MNKKELIIVFLIIFMAICLYSPFQFKKRERNNLSQKIVGKQKELVKKELPLKVVYIDKDPGSIDYGKKHFFTDERVYINPKEYKLPEKILDESNFVFPHIAKRFEIATIKKIEIEKGYFTLFLKNNETKRMKVTMEFPEQSIAIVEW